MSELEPPVNTQVTAFNFDADGFLRVIVEDTPPSTAFSVENSDEGALGGGLPFTLG